MRPTSRQAPNIELSARKKRDEKRGPRPGSLGPVLARARPNLHAILAWVYKSSVDLQVQRWSMSLACVSKSSEGL